MGVEFIIYPVFLQGGPTKCFLLDVPAIEEMTTRIIKEDCGFYQKDIFLLYPDFLA